MKPMKSATLEKLSDVVFPVYAAPKLDGVRAIVKDGVVLSNSLKVIPNLHVQALFKNCEGMDGELIVGEPNAEDVCRKTVSGVMSIDGEPDVKFYVFDYLGAGVDRTTEFQERSNALTKAVLALNNPRVKVVPQTKLRDIKQLEAYEASALANGYEGVMLRTVDSQYKFGRSTLKQGWLMKLKRFLDAEATVLGFEELQHNNNEATINELGNTERSSHKENLVAGGTLGALLVEDCKTKQKFKIGTGFTEAQRKEIWDNRGSLVNAIVTYKYFPIGIKEAPRHPVFKLFRSPLDL